MKGVCRIHRARLGMYRGKGQDVAVMGRGGVDGGATGGQDCGLFYASVTCWALGRWAGKEDTALGREEVFEVCGGFGSGVLFVHLSRQR